MGQACSQTDQFKGTAKTNVETTLSKLGLNFTQSQWEAVHSTGSILTQQEAIEEINLTQPLGCDLRRISALPKNIRKCVFICCNTYTKPEYSLGVGPVNDGLSVASFLKKIGFQIFFIHNPTSNEFLRFFKHFLRETKEYLIVYYTGHGGKINNTNGDGKSEALFFDDNNVSIDILSEAIANSGKPDLSKVCLFTDCCHSGTIYDLKPGFFNEIRMPPNIFSLSTLRNSETEKQTSIDINDQGIFTFYFFKLLIQDNNLTPISIESKINQYLKKFDQIYIFSATSPEILEEPVFQ